MNTFWRALFLGYFIRAVQKHFITQAAKQALRTTLIKTLDSELKARADKRRAQEMAESFETREEDVR